MSDQGYLGDAPIRSVLGNMEVGALLDFVDDDRNRPDWEQHALAADRRDHAALLQRLGVHDTVRPRLAQRVQSTGTLAGLWGAVL